MLWPPEPPIVIAEPYPMFTQLAATDQMPLCAAQTTHLVDPIIRPKVLLVDDNESELFLTRRSLETQDCEIVSATNVTEAFRQIAMQCFDVLITDLHMPEAGDGFAVVTAMRHTQPDAWTLVTSDYPDVKKAMNAFLLQADE